MNEGVSLPTSSPATSVAMIRTLGGIAMISGLLVVLVYQVTLPIITENQRRAVERAVFEVIPGAVSRTDFVLGPAGLMSVEEQQASQAVSLHAGYDASGELRGVAMQAAARGYQDVIKILYGYDPLCECIIGIHVLKMTETPGLGDKIAKDPEFLANFRALDAKLNGQKTALSHRIVTVKHGTKTEPWQIDSISGATISSKAIGRMLNDSAQEMLPKIVQQLDKLHVSN